MIPKEANVAHCFEGMVCANLNLARSDDLKSSIEQAILRDSESSLEGLLLVPDNLPEKKELKLTEKYAMEKG